MEDMRTRYSRLFTRGANPERLVFFSDAVFAIALTLLVIDIKVPADEGTTTAGDVIVSQWPAFLAYALSFAIIALNWMSHHRKFRVITSHDGGLMALNFVLLFFVAFVPFPTSLISEYGADVAAVVLYAFVVGMLTVLQLAIWAYAWHKGLVNQEVDKPLYRYAARTPLAVPVVFWLSIPIAIFIDPAVAMYSWFLLFPVDIIWGRIEDRLSRRASATPQQ